MEEERLNLVSMENCDDIFSFLTFAKKLNSGAHRGTIEPTKLPQEPPGTGFVAVLVAGCLIAGLALTYFAVKKRKQCL